MSESLLHLEPRDLSARLCELIRRYVEQAHPELAVSIVAHLEALYLRPDFWLDPDESCRYCRLMRHWRWLAARSRQGTLYPVCQGG
ncbi:ATP dependent RNA helicase [Caldichromatium japonicum]|uniref:ATP dependent RNA helicase n=1 Tax=Caldichromatium japonicum TaxID=2699430 RepID=A0A6G7VGH6_9GAMM|nr:ATP dependent RNA helicase [Caldichromatium japonicum]